MAVHGKAKMSMNWLDLKLWISEMRSIISGAYIDNLWVYSFNAIILRLRLRDGNHLDIIIEGGRRITSTDIDPKTLSEFESGAQTTWRSVLRNCSVAELMQLGSERIVAIKLRCGAEHRTLIGELLPRGVIVVVNDEDRIVLITETRKMRDRTLAAGMIYTYPPPVKTLIDMNLDEAKKSLLAEQRDLLIALGRVWLLPATLADYILRTRCPNAAKAVKASELKSDDVECLYNEALNILNALLNKPCIEPKTDENGNVVDFIYREDRGDCLCRSIDECLKKYFDELMIKEVVSKTLSSIQSEIERLKKSLEDIDKLIAERKRELEELQRLLNIVAERYYELEVMHNCVRAKVKQSWENIKECGNIESTDPRKGRYSIKLNDVVVELDVTKSLVEIYNALRQRVSDLEEAISKALAERENLSRKINELNWEADAKKIGITMRASRKVRWYERFHWLVTSRGLLVIGGRDASQNERLLRKHLSEYDVVMHADIHGGSVVIVKDWLRSGTEEDLREAAALAACYSKAWKLGLHSVDVFWVKPDQISLSAKPGEYMPKGGFMVYGKKNFIKDVKLELGIGIAKHDGEVIAIVGPSSYVAERAFAYAVLEPGDVDPYKLAKFILERFKQLCEDNERKLLEAVTIDDIAKRVPGKSRVKDLKCRKQYKNNNGTNENRQATRQ